MNRLKPPITYWGGKHYAAPGLLQLVPHGLHRAVCPFIGGGSVEVNLAARKIPVVAGDIFRPVANFWNVLVDPTSNRQLIEMILEIESPTKEDWRYMRRHIDLRVPLESAAWLYVINNHSYCGLMWSSDTFRPRPQRSIAETHRLAQYAGLPIHTLHSDYAKLLKSPRPNTLVFADPPYQITSRDRRHRYGATPSGEFDHWRLKEYLDEWDYWILTYSDDQLIRDIYGGYPVVHARHSFTVRFSKDRPKPSNEVFIVSKKLADANSSLGRFDVLSEATGWME